MSFNIDNTIQAISAHTDRTARLADAGIKIPAAYVKARESWKSWASLDLTAGGYAALRDGYQSGASPDQLLALGTQALIAEMASPVQLATVRNSLASPTLAALVDAWAPVKIKTYDTTAQRLQDALDALTNAVAVVDPNTSTRDVLALDKDKQQTYLSQETLAEEVESALATHADAAALAGVRADTDSHLLGLLGLDTNTNVRDVWSAWNEPTKKRGGRFVALILAGVTFNLPALEDVKPYTEPKPMETIHLQGNTGFYSISIDPHADDYAEQLARPDRVRIAGV